MTRNDLRQLEQGVAVAIHGAASAADAESRARNFFKQRVPQLGVECFATEDADRISLKVTLTELRATEVEISYSGPVDLPVA